MDQKLKNKTALITGSTSNIGRSVAYRLAAEGAHVIVSGRDQTRGEAVVRDIRDKGGDVLISYGLTSTVAPGRASN